MPSKNNYFPGCLVSGGQTGADRAGLDHALALGISHAGYCPAGRRAKDGRIDSRYNLTETISDGWPERTRLNVSMSDATVIFSRKPLDVLKRTMRGSGSALTLRECARQHKPCLVLSNHSDPAADAAELLVFLQVYRPIVNVAGNAEDTAPGTYAHVRQVLQLVSSQLPVRPAGEAVYSHTQ